MEKPMFIIVVGLGTNVHSASNMWTALRNWANWSCVCVQEKVPCRWRQCHRSHSQARMPNLQNNRLLRKGRWPNQGQAPKQCRTHVLPRKLDGDGAIALITLLASNLLVSSCSWLSSCTAPVKGPSRSAKTPWQWRTDLACGRQPRLPNVTFWSD